MRTLDEYARRINDLLNESADADDAGHHDEAAHLHNAAHALIDTAQHDGYRFTQVLSAVARISDDDPRNEIANKEISGKP